MKNFDFDQKFRDFLNKIETPTLDELEKRHKALQKRIDENLQRKEPASFENIARLCLGDKIFEQHLAKNN